MRLPRLLRRESERQRGARGRTGAWRWLSPPSSHCDHHHIFMAMLSPPSSHCDHYHVLSPWPRLSYPSLCGTCLLCSVTSYPIHLIQNTKNALYFANYDSVWLLINCYNTDLHTSWHRRRHKLKLLIKLIIYIYILNTWLSLSETYSGRKNQWFVNRWDLTWMSFKLSKAPEITRRQLQLPPTEASKSNTDYISIISHHCSRGDSSIIICVSCRAT